MLELLSRHFERVNGLIFICDRAAPKFNLDEAWSLWFGHEQAMKRTCYGGLKGLAERGDNSLLHVQPRIWFDFSIQKSSPDFQLTVILHPIFHFDNVVGLGMAVIAIPSENILNSIEYLDYVLCICTMSNQFNE